MAKNKTIDIEQSAIKLVQDEKAQWNTSTAFISDRVAFEMRNLVRLVRKNYWGVFDKPTDPSTGRRKIWIPLTESLCDAVVKNIDLDQKDIGFRAKNEKGRAVTQLLRHGIKEKLDQMFFGEILDETERQLAIDGTVVWKTFKEAGKLVRRTVDLLNIYIDPTADNLQQSDVRFTERALMIPSEIARMDGWMNTEGLQGTFNLPRTDPDNLTGSAMGTNTLSVKERDVYETWGPIPKSFITGKEEDNEEQVQGHIIVSGIDQNDPVIHLIEENKSGLKPYEEVRYQKIAGRWYGKGIAEKVIFLQLWMNIIVNIRINRSYVAQLGLFKIRKGAGITPQMLSRLPANGAVVLDNLDDLEQMVVQDASQASYADEENIISWSERLTSAFESVTGESLPASTPATNAVLQNRNAQSQFVMVKENIGMFLQRWMDRHCLPTFAKQLNADKIVRFMGDDEDVKKLIDRIVAFDAEKQLVESIEKGVIPTEEELESSMQDARIKLRNEPDLFVELLEDIITDGVDTKVFITNEELDTAIMIDKLTAMLSLAPEFKESLIKQIADLMGIDEPKVSQQQPQLQPQGQQPQGGGVSKQAINSLQGLTTQANTPNLAGVGAV